MTHWQTHVAVAIMQKKKMLGGPTSMRNGFEVRSDILMTLLQRLSVKKNTLNLICSEDYMRPSTLWQVTSCGINMDDTYLTPHSPLAFPEVWTGFYFFFPFFFFFFPPAITRFQLQCWGSNWETDKLMFGSACDFHALHICVVVVVCCTVQRLHPQKWCICVQP